MPHLREALASIGAQRCKDWTVLAWDNGSSDGSQRELADWVPSRLPGRVVLDSPLACLGTCLRQMVTEATSEYVARADADDINEPDRIEHQLNFLRRNASVLAVGSALRITDADGRVVRLLRMPCSPAETHWSMFFRNSLAHPTVVARRTAILAVGNYADLGMGQDYDLWLRMLGTGRLANLRKPLVRYRLHGASVSARAAGTHLGFDRDMAKKYVSTVFPGLDRADCLAVWDCVRAPGAKERAKPQAATVWAMVEAQARAVSVNPLRLLWYPRISSIVAGSEAANRNEKRIIWAARGIRFTERHCERIRRWVEWKLWAFSQSGEAA